MATREGSNAGHAHLSVLTAHRSKFGWADDCRQHHESDAIIYELHVKGFTKNPNSGFMTYWQDNSSDDLEGMRTTRERGLAGIEPFELEARILGKDGIYRWFLARYNPLVDEGRVRRWYMSGTEIESRKRKEDRIRQENVRLEERTRIVRELHDTLLQTVQSASLHLGAALLA